MKRSDFVQYLRETLIPDLRESGNDATAADFEACVLFMEGALEVEIITDDELCGDKAIKVS